MAQDTGSEIQDRGEETKEQEIIMGNRSKGKRGVHASKSLWKKGVVKWEHFQNGTGRCKFGGGTSTYNFQNLSANSDEMARYASTGTTAL